MGVAEFVSAHLDPSYYNYDVQSRQTPVRNVHRSIHKLYQHIPYLDGFVRSLDRSVLNLDKYYLYEPIQVPTPSDSIQFAARRDATVPVYCY